MTYEQAMQSVPEGAEWSSSFGYPGEPGCSIYFRLRGGTRYVVSNGDWTATKPFVWTVREVREERRSASG